MQFATKGGLIKLILKFDPNQSRRKNGPIISSPKRLIPRVVQHLKISNENSTASIKVNLRTGYLEIEHTIFGLSKQQHLYILDPYEALLFLHAHDFLLSLEFSNILPGPSSIGCIHAMNNIAANAILVEREAIAFQL